MKLELSQHLAEATSNGRRIESVIGGDLAEFAETWAAEYRDGAPRSAWEDVTSGRRRPAPVGSAGVHWIRPVGGSGGGRSRDCCKWR